VEGEKNSVELTKTGTSRERLQLASSLSVHYRGRMRDRGESGTGGCICLSMLHKDEENKTADQHSKGLETLKADEVSFL